MPSGTRHQPMRPVLMGSMALVMIVLSAGSAYAATSPSPSPSAAASASPSASDAPTDGTTADDLAAVDEAVSTEPAPVATEDELAVGIDR